MRFDPGPTLDDLVTAAFRRFDSALSAALPRSGPRLKTLLHRVPSCPEHIFLIRGFPHVVLPYWMSPIQERDSDLEFQTDLIYSSISGYYSIRLCDNIADGDGPSYLHKFAPCVQYFDNQALRSYVKYFPSSHPFWTCLDAYLNQQTEASTADSLLVDVDSQTFASISSRKFTGAKIPLAAVRFRYSGREDAFDAASALIDGLGGFAQFSNDFFDWRNDNVHNIVTVISSEWRRRAPEESFHAWFLREGFDWGAAELKSRFDAVKLLAGRLENQHVDDWVSLRGYALQQDVEKVRNGLQPLLALGKLMSERQREGNSNVQL